MDFSIILKKETLKVSASIKISTNTYYDVKEKALITFCFFEGDHKTECKEQALIVVKLPIPISIIQNFQ